MIVSPIYTTTLRGKPFRFFLSPLTTEPELLWHSFDDLVACLDMPRELRRDFKHRLRDPRWKADVHTVATPAGITTICAHYMAQGLIDAMTEVGFTRDGFYAAYAAAGVAAMKVHTAGMSQQDGFRWSIEAARRTLAEPAAGEPKPGPGAAA